MRSCEHRAIGDEATGDALVNLGGDALDERFLLTFGDVVALSGDYFRPDGSRGARPSDALFSLAAIPGTRDELVCALKVMSVDEEFVDSRFDVGGAFAGYRFSPRADRTDVERRVRDRYLCLAATNDDHFVAPGRSDVQTGSGSRAAPAAYRDLHQRALDEAWRLGRSSGDLSDERIDVLSSGSNDRLGSASVPGRQPEKDPYCAMANLGAWVLFQHRNKGRHDLRCTQFARSAPLARQPVQCDGPHSRNRVS